MTEHNEIAFIFDMDGTLFRTEMILEVSLEDTFNHLRSQKLWTGETPIQKYRNIMGVPLPVVWKNLLPDHSDSVRENANDLFHVKLIENIRANRGALYPNTTELLECLRSKGHRVFVASNGQIEYLKAIMDVYHLDRWICECFSIQHIETQSKTDLVKLLLMKHSIKSGALVGDRLSDFKAAKLNNLYSIGCKFYFAQEKELAEADWVINDFNELIRAVENGSLAKTIVG